MHAPDVDLDLIEVINRLTVKRTGMRVYARCAPSIDDKHQDFYLYLSMI
jgi:hypothetical protein